MKKQYQTEAQALADRCVNYSDALVALVFIGASGLGIAIADPDTRSSMNTITGWMIGGNILVCVTISLLLVVLRRWELNLRQAYSLQTDQPEAEMPEGGLMSRYSKYFYWARHTVVWISLIQITAVLLLGSLDK